MNYFREKIELKNGCAEFIKIQTNEQNSLTRTNLIELEEILKEIQADESIRAAVLTSDNEKFFSNGVDAENILNTPRVKLTEEMGQIVLSFGQMLRFDKPLLAEVTGYAMGGGAVMTLACDFRYMLEGKGRIAFTEILVGLPLPLTFIERLRETVDPRCLNEMCLLGKLYKATEAKETNLINEVASTRIDLRKIVIKKLEEVMGIAPSAYRRTKQAMNKAVLSRFEENLTFTKKSLEDPIVVSNLLEAMTALKEKRRPKLV
ncbi:enoyl-CoA hydratase/isomerase family protein [Leptospira inadai serovar Lyme str. 10]|uniref:Enoyl-CoA hydratase/isomerase family protein n=2 Tax=Leptospira inadai serovar Lyme TaxID=293084 RepID=V6HX14_9LEPT|nr:enoyl-CoA hydratase/isomerase family protein [Leptospira inadai]EQA37534.1 enoyl-CoA hydratase/isomerase family protein [Leptospira inadai serovar Lyme str. 10]PNV73624.1 enoyl-CoA hydratase [Leptospira inadai serovar Lyme]